MLANTEHCSTWTKKTAGDVSRVSLDGLVSTMHQWHEMHQQVVATVRHYVTQLTVGVFRFPRPAHAQTHQSTTACLAHRTCFYHVRRLKQVRKLLGPDVAAKLVVSPVFSRLGYHNAILAGLPRSTTAPLQRVQNSAFRLAERFGPHDHVTPTLKDRQWLPVKKRIVFKDERHPIFTTAWPHQPTSLHVLVCAPPAVDNTCWRTFVFMCQTKSLK